MVRRSGRVRKETKFFDEVVEEKEEEKQKQQKKATNQNKRRKTGPAVKKKKKQKKEEEEEEQEEEEQEAEEVSTRTSRRTRGRGNKSKPVVKKEEKEEQEEQEEEQEAEEEKASAKTTRGTRGRGKKSKPVVKEEAKKEEEQEEEEEKASAKTTRGTRGRGKKKSEPVVKKEAKKEEEEDEDEEEEDYVDPNDKKGKKRKRGTTGNQNRSKAPKTVDDNGNEVSQIVREKSKNQKELTNPLATKNKKSFFAGGVNAEGMEIPSGDSNIRSELSEDDDSRITVTNAKSSYNVSESDLYGLDCVYRRNPHYRSAAPMRLYLRRELIEVHNRNEKEKAKEEEEKFKDIRDARISKLLKANIRYDEIDEKFQDLVFGDFLDWSEKKPDQSISKVKRLAQGVIRVQTLYKEQYWKESLVRHYARMSAGDFKKILKKCPGAALECIYRIQRRSFLLLRVLDEPGCLEVIGKFFDDNMMRNFGRSYPDSHFVAQLKELNNPDNIKAEIRKKVSETLKESDWEEKCQPLFDSLCREARLRPGNIEFGRENAIKRLVHFYSSTDESRKKELEDALSKYGLQLRSDSRLCQSFIEGKGTESLSHVVSIMRLTKRLFDFGHQTFSNNHHAWKSYLLDHVRDENMTFEDACEKVMKRNPRAPRARSFRRYYW